MVKDVEYAFFAQLSYLNWNKLDLDIIKKYNHLLIIILPYLTTIFFTNIQNTNQGREIFDLFFIFLIGLYILISIISKVSQKYKNINIIIVSILWCIILSIDIVTNNSNNLIIIDIGNLIMILLLLKKFNL